MSLTLVSAKERPDLVERRGPLLAGWPEFMLHDPVAGTCWDLLYERFPTSQHFLLDDETGELGADLNSLPVRVDVDSLPDRGWDAVMEEGTPGDATPNAVSAISVEVLPSRLGQGLSRLCLGRMRDTASANGFRDLVAPVRPNWKARYPLVDIDRYVEWETDEGVPFDPWLRTHVRLGGRWLFVEVESERDVDDLEKLLAVKRRPRALTPAG